MTQQKTWSEADKDAFYRWLEEQRGARPAADERRAVAPQETLEQQQRTPATLSNRYLSARLVAYDMLGRVLRPGGAPAEEVTEPAESGQEQDPEAVPRLDANLVGIELQLGKPLKTWFRQLYDVGYYRGSADWGVSPGIEADFSLLRAGYHLELALVPLGLDQTRNILLRGGLDLLYGRSGELTPAAENEELRRLEEQMLDQVTGVQAGLSWSVGYERQLGENFWRLHGMVDGFRAYHLSGDDDRRHWSTVGLGVGISRVF